MDGGLRELSSPLVRQVGRGEQEDGLNAEGVERDEVVVHGLAGGRVGRLEGEQQAADQPEGQQEAGGHTHRVHHATQRVVLASEGMAAQHLSIRAEMGWYAGRMLGS